MLRSSDKYGKMSNVYLSPNLRIKIPNTWKQLKHLFPYVLMNTILSSLFISRTFNEEKGEMESNKYSLNLSEKYNILWK